MINNVYTFASWNINGWGGTNHASKVTIVERLGADMLLLVETWGKDNRAIELPGYVAFVNNRAFIHRSGFRNSGGVAILVKQNILEQFSIT